MRETGPERGSATAELAVVLPGVVVILVAVLLAGVVGATQVACQDAARVVARAVALGDEVAASTVASGEITIARDGDWVHVQVSEEVGVLGLAISLTGRASVLAEPVGGSL